MTCTFAPQVRHGRHAGQLLARLLAQLAASGGGGGGGCVAAGQGGELRLGGGGDRRVAPRLPQLAQRRVARRRAQRLRAGAARPVHQPRHEQGQARPRQAGQPPLPTLPG